MSVVEMPGRGIKTGKYKGLHRGNIVEMQPIHTTNLSVREWPYGRRDT